MKRVLCFIFSIFVIGVAHAACDTGQIDVDGDGIVCENIKFSVTTTNLNANDTIKFSMSAKGIFYVDCGNGGVLSSSVDPTDVSGKTITRTNTTPATYTCTWENSGAHTIAFGGTGTGYSNDGSNAEVSAIDFWVGADSTVAVTNARKIVSIAGDLSALFPSYGTSRNQHPRFSYAFQYTAITSIPATLFSGYTNGAPYMFAATFAYTKITTIPSGLFGNITTSHEKMFRFTFGNCDYLTTIPADLFVNFTTGASSMFEATFNSCDSLTTIPSGLFSNITTSASYMFYNTFNGSSKLTTIPSDMFGGLTTGSSYMFAYTFKDTKLTAIPAGLFANITTGGAHMFEATFNNCDSLTTIPSGLFTSITTGGVSMFYATFSGCSGLTSVPDNLFASFTVGYQGMFNATFSSCTNLSGYIPPSLFAGLIANNATYETDMMKNIFYNTGLDTSCPNGTTRYETLYDEYWDGHVSCTPNTITINWTGATAAAIAANNAGTAVYGGDIRTPASYDPSLVPVGKRFVGWRFRKTSQNNG